MVVARGLVEGGNGNLLFNGDGASGWERGKCTGDGGR